MTYPIRLVAQLGEHPLLGIRPEDVRVAEAGYGVADRGWAVDQRAVRVEAGEASAARSAWSPLTSP